MTPVPCNDGSGLLAIAIRIFRVELADNGQVIVGDPLQLQAAVEDVSQVQWAAVKDLVQAAGWCESGKGLNRPTRSGPPIRGALKSGGPEDAVQLAASIVHVTADDTQRIRGQPGHVDRRPEEA